MGFGHPVPADDIEGQLSHTQTAAQVTFPNLRSLFLHGGNTDLEVLLARMSTSRGEVIHVRFSVSLLSTSHTYRGS